MTRALRFGQLGGDPSVGGFDLLSQILTELSLRKSNLVDRCLRSSFIVALLALVLKGIPGLLCGLGLLPSLIELCLGSLLILPLDLELGYLSLEFLG